MKEMKMVMGRMRVRFLEKGRGWKFPGILYAVHLILRSESEKDLKVMAVHFNEMCRRRGLKLSTDKSKIIVLVGE